MLDVGCGSAILAISAYKLGIENVTGFDTDPIAISESRKNAERNSVLDKIKFFCGFIQSVRGVYDLIVANVYLEPIYHMREEFKSRLRRRGYADCFRDPRQKKGRGVKLSRGRRDSSSTKN